MNTGLKSPEKITDAFVPFRSLNVRAKFEHEKIKFALFHTTFLGKQRLFRIKEAFNCYDFGPLPLLPLTLELTAACSCLRLTLQQSICIKLFRSYAAQESPILLWFFFFQIVLEEIFFPSSFSWCQNITDY